MKKTFITLGITVLLFSLTLGATYAAFNDVGKFTGSRFTVASADIKLLNDITLGVESSNLVDEKPGPEITNITPTWSQDYPIKIYNNGSSNLDILSQSNYETANDPQDIRSILYVEPFPWDDANGNGIVETGELGTSFGRKTFTSWKTTGYRIGNINKGEVRGWVLRFSTDAIADSKQGASAIIDFEFSSTPI